LIDWYLSIPTDDDDNGKADSIKESALSAGYEDDYFYTGSDGAMVFKCPVEGYKTSSTTTYTRVELREMLRRGDTSIATDYDADEDADGNGRLNNFAFSSIDDDDEAEFGGIDGVLSVTLAVNHVTTTNSDEEHVGRIVIGQIHAADNEPVRLYYHKLPGNTNGAIYLAHETAKSGTDAEYWYNLLGDMIVDGHEDENGGDLNDTSNPESGIPLDEAFSYSITASGDSLTVTISQDGTQLATKTVDMSDSGYNDSENYMFFKAGIYLQDKVDAGSDEDDYGQISIYEMTNTHDNYDY
jgi:poly(beta-D-mannuronate) lyase